MASEKKRKEICGMKRKEMNDAWLSQKADSHISPITEKKPGFTLRSF